MPLDLVSHEPHDVRLLVASLALLAIVAVAAALTMPAIAWLDGRTQGVTASRSRVSSSIQAVATTVAFTVAYATYPGTVPAFAVGAGIAVLFGLALAGEIQAERLHRRGAAVRP